MTENDNPITNNQKKWYEKIPNAYVLLFIVIVVASILTYVIPAGTYERELVDGRNVVVPGTFHLIDQTPVGFLDVFMSIPLGLRSAADVVFIVFVAGAFFGVVRATGALESGIAIVSLKYKDDPKKRTQMIWVTTFLMGALGAVVGFENLIIFIPIGVIVSLGLGLDLMVAVAMVLGGIAVGFASSPINPYTVGVSHAIAELPLFSGMGLRTAYLFIALAALSHHTSSYAKKICQDPKMCLVKDISVEGLGFTKRLEDYTFTSTHKWTVIGLILTIAVLIFGIVQYDWYLVEMMGLFILAAIVIGVFIARFDSDRLVKEMVDGAAGLTIGAIIIGVARGIQVILEQGNIGDTIIHSLATPLAGLPTIVAALLMSIVHGVINIFIPSGSGQAMATMPIMIPLSDLIGMTRQTAVLAFQIGDGIMNLIVPTLGGMMAMLAMARVPYERWFRFIAPFVVKFVLIGWIFTLIAVLTNYGPF